MKRKWMEPLFSAWSGVTTHKLRSFLTILGIVIGVAAVISLMSIGKGAQEQILSRIGGLGSNLLTISGGSSTGFGGVRMGFGSAQTLTQEDAEAIAEQVDYVEYVSPTSSSGLQLVAGGENTYAQVYGVTSEYQQIQNLDIVGGAFFSDYEYQRGSKVVVLGAAVNETLFGDADMVGERIRVGTNIFTVIGILDSVGSGTMNSSDNSVYIPLTAMQQIVAQTRNSQGEKMVASIVLTVSDEKQTDNVIEDITSLLRSRHRLGVTEDDDFNISSMEELAETLSEATDTLTILLGAIAAISLLVGGIGVMNIMLVSVLERTREIGIRKALGARERDIWSQFLIEAALLTLTGGIVGVIFGWVAATVVSNMDLMTTLVTADIVILAVSVSVGIGLFFGFYPAWHASRLKPIDALRAE